MSEGFTGKCPMCGFSEKNVAKPVSSQINTYMNDKGEKAIFNNHVGEFTTPTGVKWVKQEPAPGTAPMSLLPKNSAQIKAVAGLQLEMSLENSAGNPTTGVAKGATIVGAPGARDSVTSALASLGNK
jgi:hypothetical protein